MKPDVINNHDNRKQLINLWLTLNQPVTTMKTWFMAKPWDFAGGGAAGRNGVTVEPSAALANRNGETRPAAQPLRGARCLWQKTNQHQHFAEFGTRSNTNGETIATSLAQQIS